MTTAKEQFTGRAALELLVAMRQVARADGVSFDTRSSTPCEST